MSLNHTHFLEVRFKLVFNFRQIWLFACCIGHKLAKIYVASFVKQDVGRVGIQLILLNFL